jgi:hypothetical protein
MLADDPRQLLGSTRWSAPRHDHSLFELRLCFSPAPDGACFHVPAASPRCAAVHPGVLCCCFDSCPSSLCLFIRCQLSWPVHTARTCVADVACGLQRRCCYSGIHFSDSVFAFVSSLSSCSQAWPSSETFASGTCLWDRGKGAPKVSARRVICPRCCFYRTSNFLSRTTLIRSPDFTRYPFRLPISRSSTSSVPFAFSCGRVGDSG